MSWLSILCLRAHCSKCPQTTQPKRVNFNVKNFRSRCRGEAVIVKAPRPQHQTVNAAAASSNSVFEQYLKRQERNEFINLTAVIGYAGRKN